MPVCSAIFPAESPSGPASTKVRKIVSRDSWDSAASAKSADFVSIILL